VGEGGGQGGPGGVGEDAVGVVGDGHAEVPWGSPELVETLEEFRVKVVEQVGTVPAIRIYD
jgi:hypothetical protein